jgi:hypothetical protein
VFGVFGVLRWGLSRISGLGHCTDGQKVRGVGGDDIGGDYVDLGWGVGDAGAGAS